MEPATCRTLFPALEERIFLNHAGIAPCSTRVVAAMRTVLAEQAGLGSAAYPLWNDRVAAVRRQAAEFIGATPAEIAFVPNTSAGLSLAAEALPWRTGEAVLVPTPDFPANVYPWQHLTRRGVRVIEVPRRNGRLTIEDLTAATVPAARVLTLSSVDFASGFAADLPAIGTFCREHGLLLVVDAIQSLGLLPVDVRRCRIDVLSCGAHKWLCGPQGIGVLFVDRELQPLLTPPLAGWKTVRDEEDFSLHFTLRNDAAVFETGNLNVAGIAGLGAALEVLVEVGCARIESQVATLVGQLADGLTARGWQLAATFEAHERAGIIAFAGNSDAQPLFRYLTANGVVTALRNGSIRVSPHFANTEEDISGFFAILDRYPGSTAA